MRKIITRAIYRDIRRRVALDPHLAERVYAIPLTMQNTWILPIRFGQLWPIDIAKIGTKE